MFPAIGRYVAAFQRVAPNTRPLVNLFPNYADPQQLGTETYEEYLERYITTVKPPLVSYDHYALMEDGSLRGGYFANLEVVRSLSLRAPSLLLEHRFVERPLQLRGAVRRRVAIPGLYDARLWCPWYRLFYLYRT